MKICLVDNYDSFTFNLVQYLAEVTGEAPTVIRNDEVVPGGLDAFDAYVISPGPGHPAKPRDFGICAQLIRESRRPVLGVCLGHQGIVTALGGTVASAPVPMHGRTCLITHDGSSLFAQLPASLRVVRYHSLVALEPLPPGLRVTARSDDGLVMALAHDQRPLWGVQFHPESICSEHGKQILRNFVALAAHHRGSRAAGRRPAAVAAAPAIPMARPWRVEYRRWQSPAATDSVYAALFARSEPAFWLDSAALRPGVSRFSFMGDSSGPHAFVLSERLTRPAAHEPSALLARIQQMQGAGVLGAEGLPFGFCGGFIGYLSYEMRACTGGAAVTRDGSAPDAQMIFADRFLAFDHQTMTWYAVALLSPEERADTADGWFYAMRAAVEGVAANAAAHRMQAAEARPGRVLFTLERERDDYLRAVKTCQDRIREGESYEICLTNRVRARADVDPLALYRTLRTLNPAPYAALLRFDGLAVHCSSPERFVRLSANRIVEAKPIKGTRPRGANEAADHSLRLDLACNTKDRAENLMITDLLRNDLGRVCEAGSVWVPRLMHVESYATVHQLVSTVRGRLADGADGVDLLRATFPPGSMTGAPKERTVEIIDELERSARGIYSGALGYFSMNGEVDLNVVIRTIVQQGDQLEMGTGGAVISLSDAEEEFDETLHKARVLMQAVALAAHGDASRFLVRCNGAAVSIDTLFSTAATPATCAGPLAPADAAQAVLEERV